ncbi:GNAT family N-acetyltransferase [Robbsia andropogonis]|uniref:GNAT family N-acetyltransferase n=1 Tax=Robbsia andropogonis TaxID=28092 RepID=UPI000AE2A656|nr:GNAT family N-acetyltransferase [Robbsia andropogonis]
MYEALSPVIEFAFDEYELHRLMANYRPENIRSGRLLERLGFEIEGRARSYLKINGAWADHVLTSRISDKA